MKAENAHIYIHLPVADGRCMYVIHSTHEHIGAMSFMHSICSCLQCRPNLQTGPKGACPDDVQGGVNNATALSGRQANNGRCVEYVRTLNASGEWSCLCQ